MEPLTGSMGPNKSNSEQRHPLADAVGSGEMRVLEAKAAGFQAREKRLDFPAASVVFDGALWRIGGQYNQEFIAFNGSSNLVPVDSLYK